MNGLRTLDLGDGPPLVLLNGMFQSVDSWAEVAVPLARFHRVIAFDMPNQGQAATDVGFDSMARYAEFALDAMRDLGVTPQEAVVFGYSFGAGIARAMAAEKGIVFRGLVLGGALPRDVSPYLQLRMETWLRLLDEGSFDLWARIMLMDIFSPAWLSANTKAFDEVHEMFTRNYAWRPLAARTLMHAVSESARRIASTAESFSCPVHVIGAEDDSLAPLRHVERFSRAIGARRLHILPGGHTLRLEALPQLIEALDSAASEICGESHVSV